MCESAYTEYVRVPIGMLWNVANICAQADSKHKVSCSGFLHNTSPHATFMQPFQCDLQPQLQETQRTTHTGTTWNNHSLQNTEEEPIASRTTAAATAAHTRYLSSPAAATLHGKIQGFVLRLPPQHKPHTTVMQPFQCDLQLQLQETQRTTHTGTTWNNHSLQNTEEEPIASGTTAAATAAHTRYLSSPAAATLHEKYKVSCCGFLPNTSPMQHSCSYSNAICNHSFKKRKELRTQDKHGATTRCRTQRRNQSRPERPQPQPPHTRGTFHRRLQPLYTEK